MKRNLLYTFLDESWQSVKYRFIENDKISKKIEDNLNQNIVVFW